MLRAVIGLLAFALVRAPNQAVNVVQISSGAVEGTQAAVPGVREFLGIPYAAPPTGYRRWKAPEPPPSWKGVRKAHTFGSRCIQSRRSLDTIWRSAAESEDCLYLSVWSPAKTSNTRLPVMVWIHGGAFSQGSSDEARYDGSSLASRGVVVVLFNYRLGVLGFLAHPELTAESKDKASGNYGLLDQVAALRWVKQDIARFGGDPANVTICGWSTGSQSVSFLMASPLSTGLFHRAIGQSGAPFSIRSNPLLRLTEAEQVGRALATQLGASSLLDLRTKPGADFALPFTRAGGPIIEGHFLADDPWNTFALGRQHKVALLAGWNSAEIKSAPTTTAALASRLKELFPNDLEAAQKVFPARDDREATTSNVALSSDGSFGYHTWKWIEAHTATSRVPVYRYLFDQTAPITTAGDPAQEIPGATHGSEIGYLFNTPDPTKLAWRAVDRQVANMIGAYWTNFARTGNPNGPGLPNWPALSRAPGRQVMRLTAEPRAETERNRDRYEFLDAIERRARGIR